MNGAELLMQTLIANDVDTVIGNPGTSEMQFVSALDTVPNIRGVLGLFEGVVTGAADGYGRMAEKPAATLLHLGPGLGNGWANLHNARRARTPILNIIGDHATFHRKFDAPLNSNIEALTETVSAWTKVAAIESVSQDVADAIAASRTDPGKIASLILPADVAWSDASGAASIAKVPPPSAVSQATVDHVAKLLRSGEPVGILLNGPALREPALRLANAISNKTGARLWCDTFPARLPRGAGRPRIDRLPYFGEMVTMTLGGLKHLVLVGTRAPVAFFAFPGKASELLPEGCEPHTLAADNEDILGALKALAEAIGASEPVIETLSPPTEDPSGSIDPSALGVAIARALPENAIIVDEANTAGFAVPLMTQSCAPHDWLCLTGGSIGQGLPAAVGAALACPDRRVFCLEGDGSAMYTIQALWTMAREQLNVTTVILANRSYAILNLEMMRMGLGDPGPVARQMLDLNNPAMDFVAMGKSMGVPSFRAETAEQLVDQLRRSVATPGPTLIEAML